MESSTVALPDGSIVIMGGWDTNPIADVWRSTDNGATWVIQTASPGWSAREYARSVVMADGSIVLGGGYAWGYTNDVWRSTDKGVTWVRQTASAGWTPRYLHSMTILTDNSIIVTGGHDGVFKNDTWRSTNMGVTWVKQSESAGWSPRYMHTTQGLPDGSIVLMGGSGVNDVWRSTDKGVTWVQQTQNAQWSIRAEPSSVVMPDGTLLLIGGYYSLYYNDVWKSRDKGVTWTLCNGSSNWSGRMGQNVVVLSDGSVVVLAGLDGGTSVKLNDVWRLNPVGSSLQNPSHTYTILGTYSVGLQSYNAASVNAIIKTNYITVSDPISSPIVADSRWGFSGQICFPSGISGTIYFADENIASSGAIIRSFTPGTLVDDVLTDLTHVYGMNPIFDGKQLAVIASDVSGVKNLYTYEPVTDALTTTAVDNAVISTPFPYTCSISGNTQYVFACGGGTPKSVCMCDTTPQTPWIDRGVADASITGIYALSHLCSGVVIGGGYDSTAKMIRSTDWGLTWSPVAGTFASTIRCLISVASIHASTGIVLAGDMGGGKIFRSTDYGLNWTDLGQQFSQEWIGCFAYLRNGVVVAGTYPGGRILKSTDYGDTWSNITQLGSEGNILSITNLGNGVVLASGAVGGNIYRSLDFGDTWSTMANTWGSTFMLCLAAPFVNTDGSELWDFGLSEITVNNLPISIQGWAQSWCSSTFNYVPPTGWTRSACWCCDGGGTHNGCSYCAMAQVTCIPTVPIPASLTGIALAGGDDGKIYRTSTGGASWSVVHSTGASRVETIKFMRGGTVAIAGTSSPAETYRSADNGLTWTKIVQTFGAETGILKIEDLGDGSLGNGIAIAGTINAGHIYRSTGYGALPSNWTKITTDNVTIPSGWELVDMVHMPSYISGKTGEIFIYITNGTLGSTVSSAIKMYTIPGTAPYTTGTWSTITPLQVSTSAAKWGRREDPSSVYLSDGSIVLMGGDDYNLGSVNDVWRSTDNGITWTQFTTGAPWWTARYRHICVTMSDGSILLVGGVSSDSDTWRSINKGSTWVQQSASAPWAGRSYISCCSTISGDVVLTGGYPYTNDVWKSTNLGVDWSCVSSGTIAPWTARSDHTSVGLPDGSILVIGGELPGGYANDTWRSTDGGATWVQQSASASWSGRGYAASVVLPDGSVVLMGGYSSTGLKNDVWRSTDKGVTWVQQTASAGWSIRQDHNAVATASGNIILMGGYSSIGSDQNDVWLSTDQGITWTQQFAGAYFSPTKSTYSHNGLAIVETGSNYDDVFSKYWFGKPTTATPKVLRHTSGTTWTDTGIVPIDSIGYLNAGSIFREVEDRLFCGDYYSGSTKKTEIGVFTSSAGLVSAWADSNFPTTSGFERVYDMDVITGASGAIYVPITIDGLGSVLLEGEYYAGSVVSNTCIITNAVPGDLYNIGGVSGDPTTHIEFTMWANSTYGSRGKGK
jgi:hypothetical protein